MTTKQPKAREYNYTVMCRPQGFAVIWHMDKCDDFAPGDYHVIEYAAFSELEEKHEKAVGALKRSIKQIQHLQPQIQNMNRLIELTCIRGEMIEALTELGEIDE